MISSMGQLNINQVHLGVKKQTLHFRGGAWGVHPLLEPRTTCMHDHEVNILHIQDFPLVKLIYVQLYS